MAGEIIHITGEVSFEDTADGLPREHFILLEMQDGYYPDEVTLAFNGHAVTIPVIHLPVWQACQLHHAAACQRR